uniref:uncharacterized protein LOC122592057 n=1 Tax=Erigeron canadensis TaxID=72917 RepID=UPI001CB96603|nr:uncharacterized protein LOC122592057 [Erigeron canadensis]
MVVRSKRVTYPLAERVKDRMVGRDKPPEIMYDSSGSEHSATTSQISGDSSPSSARSLSYLVNCFEEEDDEKEDVIAIEGSHKQDNGSGSGSGSGSDSDSDSDRVEAKLQEINSTLRKLNGDRFRNILFDNVTKAIDTSRPIITSNTQSLNRNIMLYLQNLGYNAAICKTKWESCGGLTAGNHEFIDVIRSSNNINLRYFIDLNFAREFDIARQTKHFQRLSNTLPSVFVGKSDDLKVIVKLMGDEIRRSLKSRGLVLPPWRKNRFMQNKWFGPYRRTVNYIPSNILVLADDKNKVSAVKCSMIGFNVVDNAPLLPRDNSYKII